MALQSTDIDAKLDQAANALRSLRGDAISVKSLTNRAVSELSQFNTDYSELIAAISELSGSTDPVDQLQTAKLAKIQAEAADLYVKVLAVKNGIDQLGL